MLFWLGAIFQRGRRFCKIVTPKRRINSSVVAVLVKRPHITHLTLIVKILTRLIAKPTD
jgi:hypothetical protein